MNISIEIDGEVVYQTDDTIKRLDVLEKELKKIKAILKNSTEK